MMTEYIEREAEIEIPSMRPIIEQIATQMRLETENGIVKAVQEVGFRVDKERLLKALTDAKTFYEEGYRAARFAADVVEVCRCENCGYFLPEKLLCTHEGNMVFNTGKTTYPNCFCSYGEKRRTE